MAQWAQKTWTRDGSPSPGVGRPRTSAGGGAEEGADASARRGDGGHADQAAAAEGSDLRGGEGLEEQPEVGVGKGQPVERVVSIGGDRWWVHRRGPGRPRGRRLVLVGL